MCSHCNGGNYDEPEPDVTGAREAEPSSIGASLDTLAASIPEIGQQFIEEANRRMRLNSWAGARLAIDALRKNGDVKL